MELMDSQTIRSIAFSLALPLWGSMMQLYTSRDLLACGFSVRIEGSDRGLKWAVIWSQFPLLSVLNDDQPILKQGLAAGSQENILCNSGCFLWGAVTFMIATSSLDLRKGYAVQPDHV